jgi:CMP-N-acetylneuraminic acid synthetase
LASVEFIPKKRHANVFAGGNWAKGGMVMNAAIYILDCEHIKKTREHTDTGCSWYIMDHQSSIDINDELDFRIAEMIMRAPE